MVVDTDHEPSFGLAECESQNGSRKRDSAAPAGRLAGTGRLGSRNVGFRRRWRSRCIAAGLSSVAGAETFAMMVVVVAEILPVLDGHALAATNAEPVVEIRMPAVGEPTEGGPTGRPGGLVRRA